MPEAVQPQDPHPDDNLVPNPAQFSVEPKMFANVIPPGFQMAYTRLLMAPQSKSETERAQWLESMGITMLRDFRAWHEGERMRGHPFEHWDAPLAPLGDVHPAIALLVAARLMRIQLDYSFCASQRFCWSYILSSNAEANNRTTQLFGDTPAGMFHINLDNRTYNLPQAVATGDSDLHTHSLAEINARRMERGQVCYLCGLWEDIRAPQILCASEQTTELGNVFSGPGIGNGRQSIGSLCCDCRRMLTCIRCNKFYCHNCCFANPTVQNPLMSEPPRLDHIRYICTEFDHGPECLDCVSTGQQNYFQCDTCSTGYCLRCMPPSGLRCATTLFGGSMDISEQDNPVGGLRMKYSKTTALSHNKLATFAAFKPRRSQSLSLPSTIYTVGEAFLFEYCDGCDRALCSDCVSTTDTLVEEFKFYRQTASHYLVCSQGCGRRFCGNCRDAITVCLSCKEQGICDQCLWERILTGLPSFSNRWWCRAAKCRANRDNIAMLDDLHGPWEDGWAPPIPKPNPPGGGSIILTHTEAKKGKLKAVRMLPILPEVTVLSKIANDSGYYVNDVSKKSQLKALYNGIKRHNTISVLQNDVARGVKAIQGHVLIQDDPETGGEHEGFIH
jgi:hypothetical protein